MSERCVRMDQFEWERRPHRAPASAAQELVLPPDYRYELLRRNGSSDVEILHSMLQSDRSRGQRAETVRNLRFFHWDEFCQSFWRLFEPKMELKTKY